MYVCALRNRITCPGNKQTFNVRINQVRSQNRLINQTLLVALTVLVIWSLCLSHSDNDTIHRKCR